MTSRKKKAVSLDLAATAPKPSSVILDQPEESESASPNFPIVGIGASAGGLAAFEAFFSGMPVDTEPGMAFVLVQHLDPDHKSILTELIRRSTRMPTFEVEDGMVVRPNCVYIIPPNRDMAFLNGVLSLLEPSAPRGRRLPIDFFFRSLAQDQRERSICIVLSGTGSDGALGVRAVKGEGGIALAQNPESTEYDGMPGSAIATGLVDFVLPPAEMPARLITYTAHTFGTLGRPVLPPIQSNEDELKKVFILIRAQTGHDFSQYKPSTINRRVMRRMTVHQIDQLHEYVRYLQHNPSETEALFRDLLIGVTSFFRDPEAFTLLASKCIPRLFSGKPPGSVIRVWSCGCSTGEEAYSLAILLQEQMETLKQNYQIQIFATDIDVRSVETARAGLYPANIAADITPERLARFFTAAPDGGAYRINKGIRELLIFSAQDLIKDPPFSRMDLICCRNLFIYMSGELQKRLIPLFHYALVPGGALFLGSSESVGEFTDLFATVDRSAKLYRRNDMVPAGFRPSLTPQLPSLLQGNLSLPPRKGNAGAKPPLRELTERLLLKHCTPAAVLVTAAGDILYLHGRTGRYLEPAPGEAGLNILKMAREGLRLPLTATLHKVALSRERSTHSDLRVKTNGDFTSVNLTVQPVAAEVTPPEPPLFLIILEDAPELPLQGTTGVNELAATVGPESGDRIAALEQELRAKEEYLQATIEELETTNEELKSSNEEMQSVNEELQSTNEELETSKEELQSLNEELATVNSELQTKVGDLSQANNDMNNLLAGTGIGTIFVNHQLHIQRFTPAATQVINLILSDVGRPVGHIVNNLQGYDNLVADVREVLETLIPRDIEVHTQGGSWFLMRIRPYRTLDNIIEGAVITFTETTELKKARQDLKETLRHLAVVVHDAYDAMTVQDPEGRILAWNPAAERLYGWSEAQALAMNIRELIPESEREKAQEMLRCLSQGGTPFPCRMERLAKDGGIVQITLTATALTDGGGGFYAIATTERPVG